MKQKECMRKTSIGGQALMEGIMMRGPRKTAMAVRNPQGDIVLEDWENQAAKRSKIAKFPVIRGVFGFIDSLTTGYRCLMRSAEITAMEGAVEGGGEVPEGHNVEILPGNGPVEGYILSEATEDKKDKKEDTKSGKGSETSDGKISKAVWNVLMTVSVVIAFALCFVLFVFLPSFLYVLLSGLILKGSPDAVLWMPDAANAGKWSWQLIYAMFGTEFSSVDVSTMGAGTLALRSFIKSAFEGVLKIALLVGYMALISRMKDIKRTFMYHGAEHKTIFCYEKGLELNVENVRKQTRFHPRCGTSFLILMLLVGIFVSFLIDPIFALVSGATPALGIRVLLKIVLIPLIMGLGYELLKFAGRHDNTLTRIISAPGVALQHLTVLEPTDDMIECAIESVKKVIPEDGSDRW